jgi:hypothetical protein
MCIAVRARIYTARVSEPLEDEAEVVDGLPVLGDGPPHAAIPAATEPSRALALRMAAPVQTAAAALGGFLAGAALVTFTRRRPRQRSRGLARRPLWGLVGRRDRRSPSRKAASELVQVVASRSLLVDVHLLGSPGDKR